MRDKTGRQLKRTPQVTYESVEDVHLTDPNSVYFNVGLESESETSEVLSLPGSSEEVANWETIIKTSLVAPNCVSYALTAFLLSME